MSAPQLLGEELPVAQHVVDAAVDVGVAVQGELEHPERLLHLLHGETHRVQVTQQKDIIQLVLLLKRCNQRLDLLDLLIVRLLRCEPAHHHPERVVQRLHVRVEHTRLLLREHHPLDALVAAQLSPIRAAVPLEPVRSTLALQAAAEHEKGAGIPGDPHVGSKGGAHLRLVAVAHDGGRVAGIVVEHGENKPLDIEDSVAEGVVPPRVDGIAHQGVEEHHQQVREEREQVQDDGCYAVHGVFCPHQPLAEVERHRVKPERINLLHPHDVRLVGPAFRLRQLHHELRAVDRPRQRVLDTHAPQVVGDQAPRHASFARLGNIAHLFQTVCAPFSNEVQIL
eukprot:Rhum_TRINITY_DN9589_c0_g2::Rhum_TRINITY_DN9589_c0_g2_i1::g.34191::m.34191